MTIEAKKELFHILNMLGENIDITPTQQKDAETKYNAVGSWLASSDNILLQESIVYPQGSIRLGTVVKPLIGDKFDVDLVFHVPNLSASANPSEFNRLVGERLRSNVVYKDKLERLNRGWRINYANEFHLDITPSINNIRINNSSELVPDRKEQNWKESNPKNYAEWFDAHASLLPQRQPLFEASRAGTVEPLPISTNSKSYLKRFIQLFKRHRDVLFQNGTYKDHKPISIIITTLASKAYKHCIESTTNYTNAFDLIVDVLLYMPYFISLENGEYKIMNPTTINENFAEKWNEIPLRKNAFDYWHKEAISYFEELSKQQGMQNIFKSLENAYGYALSQRTYQKYTDEVSHKRSIGLLNLALSSNTVREPIVRKNTFFGI